jgi:hypothetical protein
VQNAIQEWGKLILVYRPSETDIIMLVTSMPSEDLLAVYDPRQGTGGNFFWRVMGRDGLLAGETPLVTRRIALPIFCESHLESLVLIDCQLRQPVFF